MSTAYDRFLDVLDGVGMKVKTKGDKARAQCPSHGSRGLTLSIRRADDRTLVKCFAGCELDAVLDDLGLTVRDLFDGDPPPGYTPPPRPEPTPWDPITKGPGVDHLLRRMAAERALEADPGLRDRARAQGDECAACRGEVAT